MNVLPFVSLFPQSSIHVSRKDDFYYYTGKSRNTHGFSLCIIVGKANVLLKHTSSLLETEKNTLK